MWSPERGQYTERIFRDADEERETKDISIEDTAYWFAENNGRQALALVSSSQQHVIIAAVATGAQVRRESCGLDKSRAAVPA